VPAPLPLALYTYDVTINYPAKTVDVEQEITYPNATGTTLKNLILAVEPNLDPGIFELKAVTLAGQPTTDFTLDKQTLDLPLTTPLEPRQVIKVGLSFRLNVPLIAQGDPNIVRPQIFGYTSRQINLVDWYPFIVPYQNGWVLHKPWYYGEHLVYELADYNITLRFTGMDAEPVVASSGVAEPDLGITHYRLKNARTYAFSISDQFRVASQQIGEVTVNSYYFTDLFIDDTSGRAALDATIKAVQTYTELFGAYPHNTLAVVQGDFNDAMEYDGLFFLSNLFYGSLYDGTEKSYLIFGAAHETCHQWWFGRVGNDQAQQPWLDESLSTYCERLFYEKNYPDALPWWWMVRVDLYQPSGFIDLAVPDYGGFTPYTNATYRMGAHFLEDLRRYIGDEAFFAFLEDYSAQMNGQIATSADFFRILRAHTQQDLSAIVSKYFKNPVP